MMVKMDEDLLRKEQHFRKLNNELERKTSELMKEVENVMVSIWLLKIFILTQLKRFSESELRNILSMFCHERQILRSTLRAIYMSLLSSFVVVYNLPSFIQARNFIRTSPTFFSSIPFPYA